MFHINLHDVQYQKWPGIPVKSTRKLGDFFQDKHFLVSFGLAKIQSAHPETNLINHVFIWEFSHDVTNISEISLS